MESILANTESDLAIYGTTETGDELVILDAPNHNYAYDLDPRADELNSQAAIFNSAYVKKAGSASFEQLKITHRGSVRGKIILLKGSTGDTQYEFTSSNTFSSDDKKENYTLNGQEFRPTKP